MEFIFSILAWVSVVVFQVVVHCSFARKPKRVKDEEKEEQQREPSPRDKNVNDTTTATAAATVTSNEPTTTAAATTTTTSDDVCPVSPASVREQVLLSLCNNNNNNNLNEKEGDASLDGDEPEEFFQLLSQTGSEMARVRSKKLQLVFWWLGLCILHILCTCSFFLGTHT